MHLGTRPHAPSARRALTTVALIVAAIAAGGSSLPPAPVRAPVLCTVAGPVSEAAMAQASADYFRAHPAHGNSAATATVVAADTFLASNFIFDADHDPTTQNDVVHILQGQSVMFKWVNGAHTTTSGVVGDPNAGALWNYPVDFRHTETIVTFNNVGAFPFQCLFHGATSGMTGTIVVDAIVPSRPESWGGLKNRYR